MLHRSNVQEQHHISYLLFSPFFNRIILESPTTIVALFLRRGISSCRFRINIIIELDLINLKKKINKVNWKIEISSKLIESWIPTLNDVREGSQPVSAGKDNFIAFTPWLENFLRFKSINLGFPPTGNLKEENFILHATTEKPIFHQSKRSSVSSRRDINS